MELSNNNDTSAALDLLRWTAAQAVCVGHAMVFFSVAPQWRPPHFPSIQNLGVLVFFVLSGFLIAYTLGRKSSLLEFAIDRFARIYSALVPGLLLIAVIDLVLVWVGKHGHPQYVTFTAFFGTLANIQLHGFEIPNFGSAGQLWSLALEWNIYLFVGGLYFFFTSKKWFWPVIVACVFSIVPLQFLGEKSIGTGITYLWFIGFGLYFMTGQRLNKCTLAVCLLILCWWWFKKITPGQEYDFTLYPVMGIVFLLFVWLTQKTTVLVDYQPIIKRLADYSFSLYIVHHTIVSAMKYTWTGSPILGFIIGVFSSNVIAFVIAEYTERKHKIIGKWIKAKLISPHAP